MKLNFAIVPLDLAREVGHGPALLFGYLMAVTNLPSGTCTASYETIAEDLGISSRKTIADWANKLHERGYINRQRQQGGGTYAIQIPDDIKVSWEFNVKKPKTRKDADVPHAIALWRGLTTRYPKKELWPLIIGNLDGKSDEVVGEAFRTWLAQGYNPHNVNWTTWVKNGIPAKFKNQMGVKVSSPTTEVVELTDVIEQENEEALF